MSSSATRALVQFARRQHKLLEVAWPEFTQLFSPEHMRQREEEHARRQVAEYRQKGFPDGHPMLAVELRDLERDIESRWSNASSAIGAQVVAMVRALPGHDEEMDLTESRRVALIVSFLKDDRLESNLAMPESMRGTPWGTSTSGGRRTHIEAQMWPQGGIGRKLEGCASRALERMAEQIADADTGSKNDAEGAVYAYLRAASATGSARTLKEIARGTLLSDSRVERAIRSLRRGGYRIGNARNGSGYRLQE